MKKHLLITFLAALLLAAAFGNSPVQAQGFVIVVPPPTVIGTLGDNGWYTSDVTIYWDTSAFDPSWTITEGCADVSAPVVINSDTTAAGINVVCFVENIGGQGGNGVNIKRDATPPVLELVSPAQNPTSVNEGSSLTLQAVAQDLNPFTVGWDLDEDGAIDAPNPTSVTIPGLKGTVVPCWIVIATDEAGNVSQIEVEVSIINLPPNIDGWVVDPTIHFGGAVQLEASTSDPGGDPLTAFVEWGDGAGEPAVVKPDGSLQAEHTYAADSSYQVTLILSDDEGLTVSDSRSVMVDSPIQTIEGDLIPGALDLVNQGILNEGQADSLVVKLEGAVVALNNDRPAAPQKLDAYLNEYVAVVPDGQVTPCFLVATDVRDALSLNGWVPQPD